MIYTALIYWLLVVATVTLAIPVVIFAAMLLDSNSPLARRVSNRTLWVLRVVFILAVIYATVLLGVVGGRLDALGLRGHV